jgi:hypothetical protein
MREWDGFSYRSGGRRAVAGAQPRGGKACAMMAFGHIAIVFYVSI